MIVLCMAVVSASSLGNMTCYLKSHPISGSVLLTIRFTFDSLVLIECRTYNLGFLDL